MTEAMQLAEFVVARQYADLSTAAVEQLKIRVLDSLGCAFGALDGEPIAIIRAHTDASGGAPLCGLIAGGRSAPDRAAFHNGALVRYLDFNDSYLAADETCHPSDNLAPVLAAADYADAHGEQFLAALAVAYQVQTRLSDEAPVRDRGFDHTVQGAYGAAAGAAKALQLGAERTAHAVAISGTANNALRVTRTGSLSHWKGLAYPNTAFGAVHAAFLAMRGITGPAEVFEGNKGFADSIAGPFRIDWAGEDLESVRRTVIKKFNAEVHSQSAVEAVLELQKAEGFAGADVEAVELEVFGVAYRIIGGGEEGEKTSVTRKEEADHSLPYMIAAALLDGRLLPEQYTPERIAADDVQGLLRRVTVREAGDLGDRFPAEMPVRLAVVLKDGRRLRREQADYEGFHTRPMAWETVAAKFDSLAEPHLSPERRERIKDTVGSLEARPVRDLVALLSEPVSGVAP
jgi:2-methylcitrate dehydratase